MKKIILAGCMLYILHPVQAQQTQGRAVYERTIQLQIRLAGMGEEMEHQIPRSRTDRLEVLFANYQSLKRTLQNDMPDEESDGPGMKIRMMGPGMDDITFMNLTEGKIVEQREFATKNYIVTDSVHKLPWKLTGESKTILGYPCQQATCQRISKRTMMTMENGEMKRQEMPDTSNIVVWFTPSIPVPAGPEYQGQLPGLILEINVNDGRTIYKAIEVSPKVDATAIKEPKSGKKVTQEEFNQERDKMIQEMQRNGGRGRTIRVGGQ